MPILLFFLCFSSSAKAVPIVDSIYENIRQQALISLQGTFNRPIKIKSTGGRIIGKIILNDVSIGRDLNFERFVIEFDPIKYAANRGNIDPAISKIILVNGKADILRDASGKISIVDILKTGKEGGPPLKAKLQLKNIEIKFKDVAGLPYKKVPLEATFKNANGTINLQKFPNIDISLAAFQDKSVIAVKGSINSENNSYDLRLTAKNLDGKIFGNYLVPVLNFSGGSITADIKVKPENTVIAIDSILDNMQIKASGSMRKSLDLNVDIKNADLDKLKDSIPDLKALSLRGKIDAGLKITGTLKNINVVSKLSIKNGKFLNSGITGDAFLGYAGNKLEIKRASVKAYSGEINTSGSIGFVGGSPIINFSGRALGISLDKLSYGSPGIEGKLDIDYSVAGSLNKFSAKISGVLDGAALWDQPVKTLSGSFGYEDGKLIINGIKIASGQSEFEGSGAMSQDKDISLSCNAREILLSGKSDLGPIRLKVGHFLGDVRFKLDEKFIRAPVRNLAAAGTIEIGSSNIGAQKITSGFGDMAFTHGKIASANMHFFEGDSSIEVVGKVSTLEASDILIRSDRIRLEDLKILNSFLPLEASDPKGEIKLVLNAAGKLFEIKGANDLPRLNLSGKLSGRDIRIGDTSLSIASIEGSFIDNSLTINNAYVKTERSNFSGYLRRAGNNNLQARLIGIADLDDLKFIILRYGAISGIAKFDLWAAGNVGDPVVNMSFDISRARLNSALIDRITGGLELKGKQLKIAKQLNITALKNNLQVDGAVGLSDDLLESNVDLAVKLQKGDLFDGSKFALNAYRESERMLKPVLQSRAKIELPQSVSLTVEGMALYKMLDKLVSDIKGYKKSLEPAFVEKVDGEIDGSARISGLINDLKIEADVNIMNGNYNKYRFDKFSSHFYVSREGIQISRASLANKDGRAEASGGYLFSPQALKFRIIGTDFPIDFLKLWVDKEFSGRLSFGCAVNGTILTPEADAWIAAKKINLAGIDFSKIGGEISYKGERLKLKDINLSEGQKTSSINAEIFSDGGFSAIASLEGNSLGLINLFNDEVKWLSGASTGYVSISNKNGLAISGDLSISKGIARINKLGTDIGGLDVNASASNKVVYLKKLNGYFYGGGNAAPSPVSIYGYLDLDNNYVNLRSIDGNYRINYSNIYDGMLSIKNASIFGPLSLPLVSCEAKLEDGAVSIPQASGDSAGSQAANPIGLDIKLDIGNNIYLTSGNISALNNIFLNLEISGDNIEVNGTQNDPKLTGLVLFNRGSVSILNRDFLLLTESQKKEIYPYDLDMQSKDYAEFFGGILPKLNITAMTRLEEAENSKNAETAAPNPKKEITIISKITGIPFSAEKDKVLKIGFSALEADRSTSPPTYKSSAYTEDEIRVLLLPDFIKSAVGLNKSGATSIDTNAVMADYLNSRLQAYVFRGLERGLEKALGLESLTLQYNFGRDLRKALGAKDTSQAAAQTLGVQFVKGFFDKFFIDVKYSQPMETTVGAASQTYINYQVTYRLTSVLSISYYREPISINDLVSGYAKGSLRAGYSF
ncbi:translocation/assembly module TamB domain-containing protein [Candidatus Saganbacteria bacterium]|nr:translocation/assembly module TamB domain-containing protein [Candidatus Saganbacteria bacterium]